MPEHLFDTTSLTASPKKETPLVAPRISERPIGDLSLNELRTAITELDSDIAELETERDMASRVDPGTPAEEGVGRADDTAMQQDFEQLIASIQERKAACLRRLAELERAGESRSE